MNKCSDVRKFGAIAMAVALIFGGVFGNYRLASAAAVNDNAAGVYSDDFADASGIAASSNAGANPADGAVELKNAAGAYAAPYSASGTVTLTVIRPLQVAKWGTLSIVANTPPGTSIKAQVMDDASQLYRDVYLSGNSAGVSAFPVDLGNVPVLQCADRYYPGRSDAPYVDCGKIGAIQIRFILASSDDTITPAIDSMRFTWILTQGDLSASAPSAGPWATQPGGDQQGTFESPYRNSQTYPAFRWASAPYPGAYTVDQFHVLSDKLIGYTSQYGAYMFALDKRTGTELWRVPYDRCGLPRATVAQNGTFYGTETGCDIFYAIDTATGQLKWAYNFYGGHGDNSTVIGADGTIFTVRNNIGLINTVYAFYPDGTIKWTKTITAEEGAMANPSILSVGHDGTLYFGTSVLGAAPGYLPLGLGKLYALDPADGAIKWTHDTSDTSDDPPLVGADGTIYVGNNYSSQFSLTPFAPIDHEVKIMAINPDGTLKWERGFGTGDIGILSMALRNDGNLWISYQASLLSGTKKIIVSGVNGSTLWSGPFSSPNVSQTLFKQFVSDSVGGLLFRDDDPGDPLARKLSINYYDADHNLKWQIPYVYNTNGNHLLYELTQPVFDENGWIYSSLGKVSFDGSWNTVISNSFARVFALAPWTLAPSTLSSTVFRGDALTFTATTSMQATNPLTSEANQMQAVLDTGVKVPLAYSSTNGSGDTIWTGSYTIPGDMAYGAHSYTVQANAALVKTDIATAFASPETGSDNTGLTAAGSFTILARHAPSDAPGAGSVMQTPTITVTAPVSGASYKADAVLGLEWTPANGVFTKYKVSYSADNGATWTLISDDAITPALSWTVPDAATTRGKIKVEGYGANGALLASATSNGSFTVVGETEQEPLENIALPSSAPPLTDPTVTGTYASSEAVENNPDFNTDMGLSAKNQEPNSASAPLGAPISNPACVSGTLIKGSLPAVYYCGANGKRYVFVNDKAYFSWYPDFSTVQIVSDATLANIMIGGNITYRPGSRMIKIQSDPKVYVVARGGVLRWVETEAAATRLFGNNWNAMIDDVPDCFFVNYVLGAPIVQ